MKEYAQTVRLLNKLSLNFKDATTELRYQSCVGSSWLLQVRVALLLTGVLYVLASVLDLYIMSESALQTALFIHITQAILFPLFGLYLFRSTSKISHSSLIISAVVIAWCSHLFIAVLGGNAALLPEAYLMLIWIWLISGISLVQAAQLSLVFLCSLEVILLIFHPFDMSTTVSHQFFFGVSVLIGSLGAYLTEFYKRQNFISLEKVEEQASALVSAEQQLRQAQKMEAIGTLVGGIAHDFNNTLAAITGNIFLVKKELGNLSSSHKRLDTVEALAFRSAEMVKQLLTFSRKGIVHMETLDLRTFMDKMITLHSVILPADITFNYTDRYRKRMTICGDVNQLEQVMLNLLSNSKDAVEGVKNPRILLELEEWKPDTAFRKNNPNIIAEAFARISLTDNGYGIGKDLMEHIFEPFFTTKEVNKGTGLGLSMVYGALQSHGGLVTVESELARGTTIRLYLPMLEGVAVTNAEEPNALAMRNETVSTIILLADDDEAVRDTLAATLEGLGYKVIAVEDGVSAVERFKSDHTSIGLAILDVVMPRMGGIEAFAEIKKIEASAKVIFLSGYDLSEKLRHSEMATAKVVMKPFKFHEFSQLIKSELRR